jgi:hypothetical protein
VQLKGTQDKFKIEENKLCCGSGFIESRSGSRVLIAINCKNIQVKKLYLLLIKNCNLLIPGLHKRCPSYRKSLQPSKELIQLFFLFLWVNIALLDPDLDPDPGTLLNPDPIRIWSRNTEYNHCS